MLLTDKACPKCGQIKPEDQFLTANRKPTSYCEACRAIARASMKAHHDRKRRGISVQKGRPHITSLFQPTYISIPVPVEIRDKVIETVNALVDDYLAEIRVALPRGTIYGAETAPPSAAPAKAQPRTSRSSKRGANRPDHAEFLNSCSPEFRDRMEKAERSLFDMEFIGWKNAEKPELWQGTYKWLKAQRNQETAREPAPPEQD